MGALKCPSDFPSNIRTKIAPRIQATFGISELDLGKNGSLKRYWLKGIDGERNRFRWVFLR